MSPATAALRSGASFWLRTGAIERITEPRWPAGAIATTIVLSSWLRVALDPLWLPFMREPTWLLSTLHNYTAYGFVLMLTSPCLVDIATRRIARQPFDPDRLRKLVQVSVVILAPCYPAVPVISLLAGDPFLRSIPLFRSIPGFLVHENFLPTGMIVVIVLLLWKLSGAVHRLFDVGWTKAIAGSVLGLSIVYVIFYQWLLNACYVFLAWNEARGHIPFWFFYTAGMLVFVALFVPRLRRVYPEVPGKVWAATLLGAAALVLLFPKGGVIATLLS